jgi:hypothetical protein
MAVAAISFLDFIKHWRHAISVVANRLSQKSRGKRYESARHAKEQTGYLLFKATLLYIASDIDTVHAPYN